MCICVVCQTEFTPKSNTAGKFCSQRCYQSHPKTTKPLTERFWRFVSKSDGCWLWNGSNDGDDGYGRIKHGKGNIGSHRASWIIHFGEIPDGLQVCHKCDNPPCVRPDHLFLGTNKDNVIDSAKKGRHFVRDNRGNLHPMSKLTEDAILDIRANYVRRKWGEGPRFAQKYGVSVSAINQAIGNRRWKHI